MSEKKDKPVEPAQDWKDRVKAAIDKYCGRKKRYGR